MKKSSAIPQWWDWNAVFLLFLLLQTLALRLIGTSWTPHLYLVSIFASQGMTIGLALGYSRFKIRTAGWLSFIYMLILLPLQWTLVIDQRVSLEEQFASLWGRLYYSVSELIAQRPVEDPVFFVAAMSVAFWVVSASAGFSLTGRQNYLRAVIPSAIGILVIQHYDNAVAGRIWGLAVFTFLALLLLGRMYQLQTRDSWRSRRVFFSSENNLDLAGGMSALAATLILASFLVPASRAGFEDAIQTWNRITQPWRNFTERLENAVSAVDSVSGGTPGEFYGTELRLGRGFPLSETVMFEVSVPDLPIEDIPPRYYWRGRAYDYYFAGQWYMTGTAREEFSPVDNRLTFPDTGGRNPQEFNFTVGESRFSLLYAPSQPVWFSRPGSVLAANADADKDIVSWNVSPSLLPGETYKARSVVKNPNIKELGEAGVDYPEWITQKYLQLPDDFSPRLAALAQDIAENRAGSGTPYDIAVAVTQYLRENIEYAPTIPPVPRNRDPLEWVVFEYKQTYCVYYASAEVLMLRSLGIPARMAVGFSEGTPATRENRFSGEQEFTPNAYTIRKANAHAWPEVYFPGIGWVEFEPTGNQDPLTRPLPPPDPQDENATGPIATPRTEDSEDFAGRDPLDEAGVDSTVPEEAPVRPNLYLIPLFIALAALTVILSRRYNLSGRMPVFVHAAFERSGARIPTWVLRWEQWTLLSPIERAFESINFSLRLMKQPAPVHSTPIERARTLSNLLPHIAAPIKILLDEHQTSLYTSRKADVNRARRAAFMVRLQTILARIRRFVTGTYNAAHS